MKKRLRKKLRIGDFQELGFKISVQLPDSISEEEFDKQIEDFTVNIVGKNEMLCSGLEADKELILYLEHAQAYSSITIDQRKKVEEWMSGSTFFKDYTVSELIDVNYN